MATSGQPAPRRVRFLDLGDLYHYLLVAPWPLLVGLLIMLLGIGIPTCVLFSGSVVLFYRGKTVSSFMQLLGAACLMVVVLTHIFEALHLFPWMPWGLAPGMVITSISGALFLV